MFIYLKINLTIMIRIREYYTIHYRDNRLQVIVYYDPLELEGT